MRAFVLLFVSHVDDEAKYEPTWVSVQSRTDAKGGILCCKGPKYDKRLPSVPSFVLAWHCQVTRQG